MKKVNASPPNYPNYIIRACTNTGVWVVEQRDITTGLVLENYDFVNQEYTGPLSYGQTVSFNNCTFEQQQDLKVLRKELNQDLLAQTKSEPERSTDSGILSLVGL